MTLKSKQVITGSRLVKSRSSDNLPTSQSQVNIQMMSHTLTIREVSFLLMMYILMSLYVDLDLTGAEENVFNKVYKVTTDVLMLNNIDIDGYRRDSIPDSLPLNHR